jgi:hypothetical protein
MTSGRGCGRCERSLFRSEDVAQNVLSNPKKKSDGHKWVNGVAVLKEAQTWLNERWC